ncbi:hypothetical protein E4U48_001887 [Claviceps purpurea]|nr:hypothetical protein E4U51_004008 [Claviceps purpurea]KAG6283065.1 hypothetical protein E4U48_001887 [Claviceps purpurea]
MNNAETASRPDFLPAGELKLVLRQRGHCEQVPPFQSGARVRLTGMLQSLLDLFNEIEEESREGSGDLGQRLDALGLKLTMPNRNFIARMNNRTVVDEVPSDIKAMLIELGEVAVLDREGDKRRQAAALRTLPPTDRERFIKACQRRTVPAPSEIFFRRWECIFKPSWANGKLIKLAEYSGILPPNFTLIGIANGRYEVAFV